MSAQPALGTLVWQPAARRPELLAASVQAALAGADLPVWAAAIDPELADTAAFGEAYEVAPADSANCVVVAGRRGETTRYAAVLVLATHRADVNHTIRRELDVRKISFAAMDDAVSATGMAYGGITPIGLPADWPILIDEAVIEREWVVIGSGIRGSKLALPGAATADLPQATVLRLRLPTD